MPTTTRYIQIRLTLWLCFPCRFQVGFAFRILPGSRHYIALLINYSMLQLGFELLLNLWFLFTHPDQFVLSIDLGAISKMVHKIFRVLLPNDMGEVWELNWHQGNSG